MSLTDYRIYVGGVIPQENLSLARVPNQLDAESFTDIERLMSGVAMPLGNYSKLDFSLAGQLGILGINSATIAPDAIALTMYSAVPVADAFRGIYDSLGTKPPLLIGVASNAQDRHLQATSPMARQVEVTRLRNLLDGRSNVVIVDEYVLNGSTLGHANDLLTESGVELTSAIAGRWFEDAGKTDIDARKLTSEFAQQFHAIGQICLDRYMAILQNNSEQIPNIN